MQSYSIVEARSQLPKIIHSVEEGGVTQLTRRGKPVAVLLSVKEYDVLINRGKGSLLQALSVFNVLKKETTDELTTEEIDSWRDKGRGRQLPWE